MTYRSNYTPLDKTDYSNFAFKKSEILEILKSLNSNFSFDEHFKENNPKNYKDFFYSYDVFNGFEIACLISGYDPNQLTINQTRSVAWRNENPTFVQAFGLVLSADKANGLFKHDEDSNSYECEYTISNTDLKKYLISKNIIITGFNDHFYQPINHIGNPVVGHASPEYYQQQRDQLLVENEKLKAELLEKDQKIKKLESSSQKDNTDLISLIFDETSTDRYAPDLAYSIKLWLDVYIHHPKADSHNSKANTWIKKNTPYNGEQDDTATRRVREIATPFNDLHISRKKLLEDK